MSGVAETPEPVPSLASLATWAKWGIWAAWALCPGVYGWLLWTIWGLTAVLWWGVEWERAQLAEPKRKAEERRRQTPGSLTQKQAEMDTVLNEGNKPGGWLAGAAFDARLRRARSAVGRIANASRPRNPKDYALLLDTFQESAYLSDHCSKVNSNHYSDTLARSLGLGVPPQHTRAWRSLETEEIRKDICSLILAADVPESQWDKWKDEIHAEHAAASLARDQERSHLVPWGPGWKEATKSSARLDDIGYARWRFGNLRQEVKISKVGWVA